jgi:hypothetical protein
MFIVELAVLCLIARQNAQPAGNAGGIAENRSGYWCALAPPAGRGLLRSFNNTDWVRGESRTPHPNEFFDLSELPSPARGESTLTGAALLMMSANYSNHARY